MEPMTSRPAHSTVPADVRDWRVDRLIAAGFGTRLAYRIAADGRFDVHALIELTERRCPPELACRILAPLEPPP
jgi:hypothetical protein